MTQAGGAMLIQGGAVLANASTLPNSSAQAGGLFFCEGGSVVFSDGTILANGTAELGSSLQVSAGSIS
jgi:hypothetical protein